MIAHTSARRRKKAVRIMEMIVAVILEALPFALWIAGIGWMIFILEGAP